MVTFFFFSSSLCKRYRHLLSAPVAFIFRTRRRTDEKGKACGVSLGQQVFDGTASKGDLTQLRFIREENPAVKSQPKLFTQERPATKYLQDLLRLLLWVPSPRRLVLRPGRARLPGTTWQGQADGATAPFATHQHAVSPGQRSCPVPYP